MTRTIELADEREGRERRPGHLGICLRVFGLTTVRASSPGDWHAPRGLFRFNSTKERIMHRSSRSLLNVFWLRLLLDSRLLHHQEPVALLDLLIEFCQYLNHAHLPVPRRLDVQARLVRLDDDGVGALVDHVPDPHRYLNHVSDDSVGYGHLVGDYRGGDGPADVASVQRLGVVRFRWRRRVQASPAGDVGPLGGARWVPRASVSRPILAARIRTGYPLTGRGAPREEVRAGEKLRA